MKGRSEKAKLECRLFGTRSELKKVFGEESPYAVPKSPTVSPDDIAKFLELSAIGHKAFYQYTHLDYLPNGILTNRLLLTRISGMNDQNECMEVPCPERTYMVSFSFGTIENMSMWKLYGGCRCQSIRLYFPRKETVSLLASKDGAKLTRVKDVDGKPSATEGEAISPDDIDLWSFHDVAYRYGKAILWNHKFAGASRCPELGEPGIINKLPMFVKDYGWMAESEVRLVVRLKKDIGCKWIALDFADAIAGIKVMVGPIINGKDETTDEKVKRLRKMGFAMEQISKSNYKVYPQW